MIFARGRSAAMNCWTRAATCKASREYLYHRWETVCSNLWFLVPLSSMQLRHAVVDYLRPLGRMFGPRMDGRFAGRYQEYCDHMAPDGSWGDELCLLASAHILRRPLWVITDSECPEPREYTRKVCPPPIIDESCSGPPVFLAASLDQHFGSTEAL